MYPNVVANYRKSAPACNGEASLPDVLNMYAQFDAQNKVMMRKSTSQSPGSGSDLG